jgi:uncharacterized protein with ATP-grasp and redox domains
MRYTWIHAINEPRNFSNIDPYRDDKELATELALALYPELKEKVRVADDPLEMAVRIAIAGNIIDLGVADSYDLEATLQRVLTQAFAINDLDALRSALKQSDSILYLADNAGETVFDRVLIETLGFPVQSTWSSRAIINNICQSVDSCCNSIFSCCIVYNRCSLWGTGSLSLAGGWF